MTFSLDATARLAAIVESSDDAILTKDLNGVIQSWNRGATRIFGYTESEVIGKSVTIIIPVDRLHEEGVVLGRIRAGEKVDHFETVRRRKDGILIDISLTVSPIRNDAGEIVGASKIARDITEQKRLQREAAEASRAKDDFLATLSHELRTPLNAILGYLTMLRRRVLDQTGQDKALEVIGRNAESLAHLVNDVLDTSRVVTGRMTLVARPTDLGKVVEDAIASVRPAVEARELRLETDLPPGVFIQGDPDRLRQVVWNLLTNAVKFTPPGGTVAVTLRVDGRRAALEVRDTGIGMEPDAIPLVFQRFWQAQSGSSRESGGLGLGLALARHLIELHGGTIYARSAGPGHGSTFGVELPLSQQAAEQRLG